MNAEDDPLALPGPSRTPFYVGGAVVLLLGAGITTWALLPTASATFEARGGEIDTQLERYRQAAGALPAAGTESAPGGAPATLTFEGDTPNADLVDVSTLRDLEMGRRRPSSRPLIGGGSWLARVAAARDEPKALSSAEAVALVDGLVGIEHVLVVGLRVRAGQVRDLHEEERSRWNNAPRAPETPLDPEAARYGSGGMPTGTAATGSVAEGHAHLLRLSDGAYLGSVPVKAAASPPEYMMVVAGPEMPSEAEQVESEIRSNLLASVRRQIIEGLRASGVHLDTLP